MSSAGWSATHVKEMFGGDHWNGKQTWSPPVAVLQEAISRTGPWGGGSASVFADNLRHCGEINKSLEKAIKLKFAQIFKIGGGPPTLLFPLRPPPALT